MVAGALHHLGVSMGDDLTKTYEDRRLSGAVERGDIEAVESIISQRSSEHAVWGWKRPSSFQHLDSLEGAFENPHYVVVFRDLLAIANRRSLSMGFDDIPQSMLRSLGAYRTIIEHLRESKHPALLLSYEKCLRYPENFVHHLAEFVGINAEERLQEVLDFIDPEPAEYLHRSSRMGRGSE